MWEQFSDTRDFDESCGHEKTPSFPNASVGNPRPCDFLDSRQRHSGMTAWVRSRHFLKLPRKLLPSIVMLPETPLGQSQNVAHSGALRHLQPPHRPRAGCKL